MILIKVLLVML